MQVEIYMITPSRVIINRLYSGVKLCIFVSIISKATKLQHACTLADGKTVNGSAGGPFVI